LLQSSLETRRLSKFNIEGTPHGEAFAHIDLVTFPQHQIDFVLQLRALLYEARSHLKTVGKIVQDRLANGRLELAPPNFAVIPKAGEGSTKEFTESRDINQDHVTVRHDERSWSARPEGHVRLLLSGQRNGANLLIEDTIASDNVDSGIYVHPTDGNIQATFNRITANNNQLGGVTAIYADMTIDDSVISNNGGSALTIVNGVTWLSNSVISGNGTGVNVSVTGTVNSYGDNFIRNNTTPVSGTLTPVTTQ
jgi:hypothetical protein